jgi:hypothetical protein
MLKLAVCSHMTEARKPTRWSRRVEPKELTGIFRAGPKFWGPDIQ